MSFLDYGSIVPLEKLKGKNEKYYSIRINNKWRITFIYEDGNAFKVRIIDYH